LLREIVILLVPSHGCISFMFTFWFYTLYFIENYQAGY